MKKSIEYNTENATKLAECLCNFKTKKEAFNFFSGSQYTFEQVKYFYIKYKEDIESRRKILSQEENYVLNVLIVKNISFLLHS